MIDGINVLDDLRGDDYQDVLSILHNITGHRSYLEIGTLKGSTLRLSKSPSIAIDPSFQLNTEVIGQKPSCSFYQLPSDDFFAQHDASKLLGRPVNFAFLDGMHHAEFLLRDFFNTESVSSPTGVIAMHDCVPLELPMTDRVQEGTSSIMPHRRGWWTGDVWKAALVIKRHRPDLRVVTFDCPPTGLVIVTGLDPSSTVLKDRYEEIVDEMNAMALESMTIKALHEELALVSTRELSAEYLNIPCS